MVARASSRVREAGNRKGTISEPPGGFWSLIPIEVGWLVVLEALEAMIPEPEGLAVFRPDLCCTPYPIWHLFRWLLCREGSCGELAWGIWNQLT